MKMRRILRIGSRESRLALAQAQLLIEAIRVSGDPVETELVPMKSTGDVILDRSLEAIGGKGLFTRELEEALLDGRIDVAVHSLKDMPMDGDSRLCITALSSREDPRDALVYPAGLAVPASAVAGCSSARRRVQLQRLMPGVEVLPVRGNVNTRLRKLEEGQYGMLVLAAAGLRRLGMPERISRCLSVEEMIPAAGQGILAVQGRAGETWDCLDVFRDPESVICWAAEQAFVSALGGGCTLPIGAYARICGTELLLHALYADESRGIFEIRRMAGSVEAAARLGEQAAALIRKEAGV